MTPLQLMKDLKKFIEKKTGHIMLYSKVTPEGEEKKSRSAKVYLMTLPTKETEEKQLVPYILLQLLTGKDDQKPGEKPKASCKIRIVVTTYAKDDNEGVFDVINLITTLRIELEKAGTIGKKYNLLMPLEYLIYDIDLSPFYGGEMMTNWSLPPIEATHETEVYSWLNG